MASGFAPYQESSYKTALRLLGGGLRGLGAVPQGANFGQGLGAGYAASARASDAARQAAMEYAARQEAQRRQAEKDQLNQQFMEAKIEKMKKPPKPEKVEPWNMDPEERARHLKYLEDKERSVHAGRPVKTATGTKPKAPPKPPKIPRRIPLSLKVTEQDIIDSIGQETDPDALSTYVTGRGSADSEGIRRAAQIRVGELMRQRR